jgi:hypothetical protein
MPSNNNIGPLDPNTVALVLRDSMHPPPAYKDDVTLQGSQEDALAINFFWDTRECPENWAKGQQFNLNFGFVPEEFQKPSIRRLFRNRQEEPKWCAWMRVRVKNIPRLMRRGFHWSEWHVMKERNTMTLNDRTMPKMAGLRSPSWKHTRFYHLADILPYEREWVAELYVFSKDAEFLSNFQVNQIQENSVYWAKGETWKGKPIYGYQKESSAIWRLKMGLDYTRSANFNAIYGNLPLEGWWPWPKRGAQDWTSFRIERGLRLCGGEEPNDSPQS